MPQQVQILHLAYILRPRVRYVYSAVSQIKRHFYYIVWINININIIISIKLQVGDKWNLMYQSQVLSHTSFIEFLAIPQPLSCIGPPYLWKTHRWKKRHRKTTSLHRTQPSWHVWRGIFLAHTYVFDISCAKWLGLTTAPNFKIRKKIEKSRTTAERNWKNMEWP